MLRPGGALLASVLAVVVAGCGGAAQPAARTAGATGPAPTLAARDPAVQVVDPPGPQDYARPLAVYRRHVRRELTAMLADAAALRGALARDDLSAARAAWVRASGRYGTIGAAYGAFGALDAAIDGRPGGLPGATRSRRFSGLHRVELALWQRRSTRDARPAARRLQADVTRLRDRVATLHIEPLDYALRAHEILEDTLHLQLSGVAAPWSDSALVALRANVAGTRVVLRTLRGMIRPRDTTGAYAASSRALARIERELRRLARPDGRLPAWSALDGRARERVNGLTAAAAEQLAYVPELIDPRPRPRAASPFGP